MMNRNREYPFMLAEQNGYNVLTLFFPEMHTDKGTDCTLLGPVDCDSFYKWIPLNRCSLPSYWRYYIPFILFSSLYPSVSLDLPHYFVTSTAISPFLSSVKMHTGNLYFTSPSYKLVQIQKQAFLIKSKMLNVYGKLWQINTIACFYNT